MEVKTDGRGLKDAIDGVAGGSNLGDTEGAYSLALAQAFSSLTRCVDTQSHDVTLLADVQPDAVTVSIVIGKASEALAPDTPWQNPHLAEIDRERQASKAAEDKVEVDRIRALFQ
jgi:hypothetical protein